MRKPTYGTPEPKRSTSTATAAGDQRQRHRVRPPAVPPVQPQHHRGQRHDAEVHADEPQRLGDRPGGQRAARPGRAPATSIASAEHQPHGDEHRGGPEQPPARDRTKSAYRPPRRRSDASAIAWEKPPTKKNTGMTWSSQVSGCSDGTMASTLVALHRAVPADQHDGHQPVADHHDAERGDAQQVDVPVPGVRGGVGELGGSHGVDHRGGAGART